MLNLFARLVVLSTLILIFAGGLVTSTGSGLAVPDWPTTYGWSMFTFPLDKMVGGIFYEHGHRLIASTVGMLIVVLAVWLRLAEPRRAVRRLGYLALAAVITQGILGGITVLYFLPEPISISHAGLAQLVFCLTVTIALVTSRGWIAGYRAPGSADAMPSDRVLQRVAIATTLVIYLQILVGATMRHTDAGLAIPDFPLVFGGLVPPLWDGAIAVHFAHRVGAVVVTLLIAAAAGHVFAHHRRRGELLRPALLLLAALVAQVALGAWVIWTEKQFVINSAHVANGALVLGTSLVLTLRAHRTSPLASALAPGAGRAASPRPRRGDAASAGAPA
ncbi:MAG: heme A synthase [Acidimicrobiia bacterium]|nr:heme A synthase [Acidimicrobiia bacterium]